MTSLLDTLGYRLDTIAREYGYIPLDLDRTVSISPAAYVDDHTGRRVYVDFEGDTITSIRTWDDGTVTQIGVAPLDLDDMRRAFLAEQTPSPVEPIVGTESWSPADLARSAALLDMIEDIEQRVSTDRYIAGPHRNELRHMAVWLRAFGVDHGMLDAVDGPSDADRESL